MVALRSVQGRTSLTHPFYFCQKNKKGGLDQYGAERFGRFIFLFLPQSEVSN